jgi:cell fate regulator YaaT (PSP1 superfamily)
MGMVMAVSFTRYGRLYYLDPGPYSPAIGDRVLVPTDSGTEVAECVWAPQYVSEEIGGLPVCAGLAGDDDLERDERNRRRRAEGKATAKRLIRKHELPMKVVGIDYLDHDNIFKIYFSAPHRVDFRALVRDLARNLRARVELRQVGPRDEARLQGGIGPCGRDLCCATFLTGFEPVSVRMAKDQDLPVNPLRIAGACGRLMCCLKYEHPLYVQAYDTMPPLGAEVETPSGTGKVVGRNVPADTVTVRLDDGGRRCACPSASVCSPRRQHDAMYADPAGVPNGGELGSGERKASEPSGGEVNGGAMDGGEPNGGASDSGEPMGGEGKGQGAAGGEANGDGANGGEPGLDPGPGSQPYA